jgi:hypothetical protein
MGSSLPGGRWLVCSKTLFLSLGFSDCSLRDYCKLNYPQSRLWDNLPFKRPIRECSWDVERKGDWAEGEIELQCQSDSFSSRTKMAHQNCPIVSQNARFCISTSIMECGLALQGDFGQGGSLQLRPSTKGNPDKAIMISTPRRLPASPLLKEDLHDHYRVCSLLSSHF